jgi:hypothetical protein
MLGKEVAMPTLNKLLVTGLALGKSIGSCDVCNFDYAWIIQQPSLFVWADKIVLTPYIWEIIEGKNWPEPSKLAECCKLIFDMAGSDNMIEILDPSKVITESMSEAIYTQIEADIEAFKRFFPDRVRLEKLGDNPDSPFELVLDEQGGYCPVRIWSIYASLILARQWDTTCLLDRDILNFCKYKFGISNLPQQQAAISVDTFKTVFKPLLPNVALFPEYAIESEGRCKSCKSETACSEGYLRVVEERMRSLLDWRRYDEVQEIKRVISSIVELRDTGEKALNPGDILREFEAEEARLRKQIQSVFPKVTRWANVATMLSIPVAVAGLATGASLLTLTGSAVAGAAQIAKEGVGYMKSKYQWVSFLTTRSTAGMTEE